MQRRQKPALLFLDFLKVSIANLGVAGLWFMGSLYEPIIDVGTIGVCSCKLSSPQKRLIWLLLFYILALPFHFIAHYGNELVDYVARVFGNGLLVNTRVVGM